MKRMLCAIFCCASLSFAYSQAAQPGGAAAAKTTGPAQTAPSPAAPAPSPYLREATVSESGGQVHITANSPRPLAQVLDALQLKYKWVVSYEDPQFTAPQDSVTVTQAGDIHRLLPAGGDFTVDFSGSAPDEEKTLRLIVDAYNHSKNPGRFEVRRIPEGDFYVVGTAANDDNGHIEQQKAAFDLVVTLSAEDRTITETLNLICQEIAKQIHADVFLGVSPRSLLEHTNVKVGGKATAARDLIVQALAAVHKRLYWHLLFDPSSKNYYLDVHTAHVQ